MPVFSVAIAVAIGIVVFLRKARYHYERLPKIPYVMGAPRPNVTVIGPFSPEGEALSAALDSLPGEVAVVEGGTVDDARNASSADQSTESDWIILAGENTTYVRVFLPSLIHYAQEEELDMVSLFLKLEPVTLAEKILLPYSLALYFTGVNSSRVNGRPPGEWLASGQCLLLSRTAYQALRPSASVRSSLVEAVELAKAAAGKGMRARVARAEHMGTIRPANSLSAVLAGFERNSLRLLRENPFTGVQVVLTSLLLTAWLPLLALLIWTGYSRQAILFALLPSVILFPWYRSVFALFAPAAIYLFQFAAVTSLAKSLGRNRG